MSDDDRRKNGDDAYTVGYRKPPAHSRFKPGQSGNPKGKKKGNKSFKATVGSIFSEKIKVQTPRGTKTMSKLEALVRTNMNNALQGDPKAIDQVLKMAREAGLVNEIAETLDALTMQELTEEDKAILERFGGRQTKRRPRRER